MGGCSSDLIKDIAVDIASEFAGKSAIGKLISIISSSRNCKEDINTCSDLAPFMKCKFFEGQKEAYDLKLIMMFVQIISIALLSIFLYKKTKKVAIQFINRNNNANMAISRGEPEKRIRRQSARRVEIPEAFQQEDWV